MAQLGETLDGGTHGCGVESRSGLYSSIGLYVYSNWICGSPP